MTIPATASDFANGGSASIAQVALRHLGEVRRPDGIPWSGWCEMFVGNVADEAGVTHTRFPTALTDSYASTLFQGRAPAGSLVFFDQRASIAGHVGIALGDGTMISALAQGIVRTTYEDWASYIGWRPYPGSTPAGSKIAISLSMTVRAAIPEALAPAPTHGNEDLEAPIAKSFAAAVREAILEALALTPSHHEDDYGEAVEPLPPDQMP